MGYRMQYPPKGRLTIDGGKNSKIAKANLLDNESPDCLNVVFSDGAVATRGGSTRLNTAPVATASIDGFFTRHQDTSETMVVFANNSVFALTGTSTFTSIPSALSVFTAGIKVGGIEYQEQLFVGNGSKRYKWNGTNFTQHGVPAPTGTVGAASGGTGAISGDYRYKVSYVNSYAVEGDVGPASTTLTVASAGTISLSSLPVAPTSFGVSARRIYRTEAGGTEYLRVAEIANNTATTYSDSTLDVGLGVAAPTDNGEPPLWSFGVLHQDRLFVNDSTEGSYIWYSEIAEPHIFKSTNFIRVGDATVDIIVGIDTYENQVLIRCRESIWSLYMPSADPTEWSLLRLRASFGSRGPFAAVRVRDGVMFPAVRYGKFLGFALVSGTSVAPDVVLTTAGSVGSELQSQRIEPDMFLVQEGIYLDNIVGVAWKNRAWFSVPYGSGQTTNNRIYVFDDSIADVVRDGRPSWVPWTGMNAHAFTVYSGKIYYADSTNTGFIYEADTSTYNDNGSAIESYIWTKEFPGRDEHTWLWKDFREVQALVENYGDYSMDIGYRADSDQGVGSTQQIHLDPGSMLWGTDHWSDLWGAGVAQQDAAIRLGQIKGRRIQLKFCNQNKANQAFKVHNIGFAYNIRGER